jgi:hypothetical protein
MAGVVLENQYRSHQKLQTYWNTLKGTRTFPKESEINPDDIADIWSSCFLVSINEMSHGLGFRYSYLGDEIIEAYGEDIHNPDIINKLVTTTGSPMTQKFEELVKTQQPVIDESEFINLKHLNIRYRTCMLPLGSPDDKLGFIIGCMRWKAY